jgi:hypothetical protein
MSKPQDTQDGMCMMCDTIGPVRHIALYVVGSEGLFVCHDCEMFLVRVVRALIFAWSERVMAQNRSAK